MSYRNWKQHESIGPDGLPIPREQPKGALETWENIGNRCHSGKAAILRESRLHWKSHDSLGFLQNIGKQAKPAIRQGLQSHDSSRVLLLRWGSAEIVKGKHSYTTTSIDSVKWNDKMTGTSCPPGKNMKITGTRSPPMEVGPLFFEDGFLQSNMLQGVVSKDMHPRSNPTQMRARVYLETGKVQMDVRFQRK